MAVDVVTEFGANTKKFDAAVEKSSKKAQKNLENIGKGARVAGGAMGELVEKFNNLSSGGKLGLIAAGLGVILMLSQKISEMSEKMFAKSVQDVERMTADFKALSLLRSSAGKSNLSQTEQVELNRAIGILRSGGIIGNGVSIQNGKLQGFNARTDEALERKVVEARRKEINIEIRLLQAQINKYDEEYQRLMTWRWSRIKEDPFSWGVKYIFTDPEKAEDYMNKKVDAQNEIMKLVAERNKLADRDEFAGARADARFADIADEERKKLAAVERARKLKELNEKRSGISFMGGSSQMFTNSLTARGGWAGGGMVWDTGRFQQQLLQYNAQQQATLQAIEKQIEELQRI